MRVTKKDLNRIIQEEYQIVERRRRTVNLNKLIKSNNTLTESQLLKRKMLIHEASVQIGQEMLEEGFFGNLFDKLLSGTMVIGKKFAGKMETMSQAASTNWKAFKEEVNQETKDRHQKAIDKISALEKKNDSGKNDDKIEELKKEAEVIKDQLSLQQKMVKKYEEGMKAFNSKMAQEISAILMDEGEMAKEDASSLAGTITSAGSPALTGT